MCLADAVVWSSLYPVLASESAGSGGKGQECMEVGCMYVESIYSCVYVPVHRSRIWPRMFMYA